MRLPPAKLSTVCTPANDFDRPRNVSGSHERDSRTGCKACRDTQEDGVPSSSDNSCGECARAGIATADARPPPPPPPTSPPEPSRGSDPTGDPDGDPAGDADGVRSGSTAITPPADAAMSSANHIRGADKNATTSAMETRSAGSGASIPERSRCNSGANCCIIVVVSSSVTLGSVYAENSASSRMAFSHGRSLKRTA